MELTENNAENTENQEEPKKRKRKNPFNVDRKEEREKRRLRRARIIIRNISYKATEETLRKHFEQFGTITELNLLKRPDGKLVGCAFIQYEKVNEAAKAISKATNKEFLGRTVYLDWALGKDEFEKRASDVKTEVKEEDDANEDIEEAEDAVKSEAEEDDSEVEDEEEDESSEDDIKEEESDEEDDEKEKIKKEETEDVKPKKKSNDVQEGCTIFIKNVPFDATNDDLRKCCRKYGPLYYALINTDRLSGHSKGTGFVKFKSKDSADLCLKAGEEFVLMGTVMEPHLALSRDEVRNMSDSSKQKTPSDSRNLYLAKEGLIMANSSAAEGVSASDMAKRHKLEQVKTQILKNLNRFVSKNRLSLHNLPFHYDDEKLRKLVIKFTNLKPHECRVMRENRPSPGHPQGKSKGFGFMSFKTHQDALTALRKLNNNPAVFGAVNRPIVAFSIEDRSVHNVKEKRLKKSQENNPTFKQRLEKLKEKKKNKKNKTNGQQQKDSKDNVKKDIQKKKKQGTSQTPNKNEGELDDFAGIPAKPGTFIRMRSNMKIKEQAQVHAKHVADKKREDKRRKERRLHAIEKKEIVRPKQGKKKPERDNFSLLVNKYKKMIDTNIVKDVSKTKRSKWYVD